MTGLVSHVRGGGATTTWCLVLLLACVCPPKKRLVPMQRMHAQLSPSIPGFLDGFDTDYVRYKAAVVAAMEAQEQWEQEAAAATAATAASSGGAAAGGGSGSGSAVQPSISPVEAFRQDPEMLRLAWCAQQGGDGGRRMDSMWGSFACSLALACLGTKGRLSLLLTPGCDPDLKVPLQRSPVSTALVSPGPMQLLLGPCAARGPGAAAAAGGRTAACGHQQPPCKVPTSKQQEQAVKKRVRAQ